jgi:rhodanese-related sulfurtransferase
MNQWSKVIWQGASILLLSLFISLGVNALRPNGLALVADWSPEAQLTLDSGDSLVVPIEEAEELFFSQSAVFLDARSPQEYEMGRIQGAVNLPWEEFDAYFPVVAADLPPDTLIIAYCDGESCGLSKEVAMALKAKGYENVRVLVNGWSVWQQRSLPTDGE